MPFVLVVELLCEIMQLFCVRNFHVFVMLLTFVFIWVDLCCPSVWMLVSAFFFVAVRVFQLFCSFDSICFGFV